MAYNPAAHSIPPPPPPPGGYEAESNLMLQMGINYGQTLLQQGLQRSESNLSAYLPFLSDLRCYFRVDNRYVRRKLGIVCFPFLSRFVRSATDDMASGASTDNFNDDQQGGYSASPAQQSPTGSYPTRPRRSTALPINDPFALDLYIPLMAVITYVTLSAFIFGLSFHSVTSEYLISTLTAVTLWYMGETLILKGLSYATNVGHGVSFLDIMSLCGYKYVLISLAVLTRQVLLADNYAVFMALMLYVCVTNGFFVTKSTLLLCTREDGRVPPRARLFAIIVGVIHFISIVVLCVRPHY